MPAGNPGAKAAKKTLVASLHYSQRRRQPAVTVTVHHRKKEGEENETTHTPATSYYLCENREKKPVFLFLRRWKKKK